MSNDTNPTGPPPLPYSLHTRKRSIAIASCFILAYACFVPEVLFYALRYGTSLKEVYILAIISAVPTLFFVDFARRTYLLVRKDEHSRPLGSGRWGLDFFHFNTILSIIVITLCFAIGCSRQPPNLALLSLPLPYLITFVGVQCLFFTGLCFLPSLRTPFRISSLPAGSRLRPPPYTIIEDVVAVNGAGGKEYRRALNERYESSAVFREMMIEMGFFWGVGGTVVGLALIIVIAEVNGVVAFGIAWGVPWVWAAISAWVTIIWVQKKLRGEKDRWCTV